MQDLNFSKLFSWIILLSAVVFSISSCSTEVNLNAPYESEPVIFGLLDSEVDTQWVKINRTWFGEGDQNVFAQIQDSSEYENSRLQAQFVGVSTGIVYPLKDTILDNKDENGIFFGPEYKAYYAESKGPNALDPDSDYRLELVIDDTVEVYAETDLIQKELGTILTPPMGLDDWEFGFASVGPSEVTHNTYLFKWKSTEGAARYDAYLIVHYKEYYWADDNLSELDSTRVKSMEIFLGNVEPNDADGNQTLSREFDSVEFYTNMASRLEVNPRITRELGCWDNEVQISRAFDFVLMVANDHLATYLEINSATNSIVQETPEYDNVDGGLGLWASRTTVGVYGLGYTTDTIEYLQEGDGTAALNFCTPNPNSDYFCHWIDPDIYDEVDYECYLD